MSRSVLNGEVMMDSGRCNYATAGFLGATSHVLVPFTVFNEICGKELS
jgi:hypothetical protein